MAVIDHTSPYIHFSETTAAQEVTDGTIYLVLGIICLAALTVLFIKKREFIWPPYKKNQNPKGNE